MASSSGEPVYDAGIFFDNEPDNIDIVDECGYNMMTVLVPMTHNPVVDRLYGELDIYINTLSEEGKATAKVLNMLAGVLKERWERLDYKSGINASHIADLKTWVQEQQSVNPGGKLVALFDWDRTLSMIEGLFAFGTNGLDGIPEFLLGYTGSYLGLDKVIDEWVNVTPEGYTEYYCGGPKRVEMLQEMFDFLYANEVDTFVLTNNPICINNRKLLQQMMDVLTKGRPVGYLCSNKMGGVSKKNAIQQELEYVERFKKICPAVATTQGGGRRKKQTRKQKYNTHKKKKVNKSLRRRG